MLIKIHEGMVKQHLSPLTISSAKEEPTIIVDEAEVAEFSAVTGKPVATIDIVNDESVKARFWIDVVVRRGRPVVCVTTKPDKAMCRQVSKKVQGTFNLL